MTVRTWKYGLLLGVVVLVACTVEDSESLLTSGITAYMEVIAEGDGNTDVRAWLTAGNKLSAPRVELSGDDQLIAWGQNGSRHLRPSQSLLGPEYSATLEGDSLNTEFAVSFERSVDSSTHSTTTLPDEFEITFPEAGSRQSGDIIQLRWETSGAGRLRLSLELACHVGTSYHYYNYSYRSVKDDGAYQVSLEDIVFAEEEDAVDPYAFDSCEVTATLDSRKKGQLDTRFGPGGYIQGIQRRVREFTFVPSY